VKIVIKRKESTLRINLYNDDDDVYLDKLVERCENRHDDDVYLDKLVERCENCYETEGKHFEDQSV
jgi:hypothetical protein